MILERTDNEILIRLPSNVDVTELQNMLDYLRYKELTSHSAATIDDTDELSRLVNQTMWEKIKAKRGIQ
jgi:hypothetical protein